MPSALPAAAMPPKKKGRKGKGKKGSKKGKKGGKKGYYSMAAKSKSPKKGMTMRIGKDSRHS